MDGYRRVDVRVEGVVQGVGFRPFVYSLAGRLGLAGRVGNDVHGVFIEVEGARAGIEEFLVSLERDAPALAGVERITVISGKPRGVQGFAIAESDGGGRRRLLVSPDTATCDDCLRELSDPGDRRFGYPFINCTNCGPRFTIVRDVPYDRELTTMAGFSMCADCAAEYHDPGDRRFHAQPTCCPACGPRLRLLGADGEIAGDPIAECARLLLDGAVVAVKGLGGYHLAVLAGDEAAAGRLRRRKHREDKPFAVMVRDLDEARSLCSVDEVAAELLTGRSRPVVLLPRATDHPTTTPAASATSEKSPAVSSSAGMPVASSGVAAAVAPGNRSLGLMLPYTPLHHLLMAAVGAPTVLTSGNVSDEPIAYRDADAFRRLDGLADAFLTHDRAIHVRTDDSVVRPLFGRGAVLRRSRGLVPEPVALPWSVPRPVLACGAELKNTFCLADGHRAFISHHIGDLENYETLKSFVEGIEHFSRLFDIRPEVVAHDLHPEYLSTKHALEIPDVELVAVQHHHAHIASCLADNAEPGPVIGVAFDGLGYGTDGTLWGGEFLLADLTSFERVGHLAPVPLPGGAAAIRQPWRMAAAYLGDDHPSLDVVRRHERQWTGVRSVARGGVNAPLTSSAGRLFDAVSAVLGLRDEITYEGQAAIELEQHADPSETGTYPVTISSSASSPPVRSVEGGGTLVVSGGDLVRAVVDDLAGGVSTQVIAARFHNGVAGAVERCCVALRESTGVSVVALSGGVFQNVLLVERTAARLSAAGFRVLTHSRVPTNDGGISLGQAAVAGARDRHA